VRLIKSLQRLLETTTWCYATILNISVSQNSTLT